MTEAEQIVRDRIAIKNHVEAVRLISEKHKAGKLLDADDLLTIGSGKASYDGMAAAAAALGIKTKWLQEAKKKGAPGFKSSRVRVDLLAPWLAWHFAGKLEEAGTVDDLETVLLRVKIERQEHARDVEKGKFLLAVEIESQLTEMIANFSRVLDGRVPALAADVVGCGSIAEAEKRIRAADDQAKRTLRSNPRGRAT